jgi:hypothetical protein
LPKRVNSSAPRRAAFSTDDCDPDIHILGVTTIIGVEATSGRILHDALSRLDLSSARLDAYSAGKDDYDEWDAWGGA